MIVQEDGHLYSLELSISQWSRYEGMTEVVDMQDNNIGIGAKRRVLKSFSITIIILISLMCVHSGEQNEEMNHYYFSTDAKAGYKDFRMKIDLFQETLSDGKFTFYMGNVDRENLVGELGISASLSWPQIVDQLHDFKNSTASYVELIGISLDFIDGWIEIARGADVYVLSKVLGLDDSYLSGLRVSTLITSTFIFDPSIGGLLGEFGLGDDTTFKMGLAIEIDYSIQNTAEELTLFPLRFMQSGVVARLLKLVGFGLEVEIVTPSELQIESVDSYTNHFRNLEEEHINYVAAGSEIKIVRQPIWFSSNTMFGVLILGAITSGIMRGTAKKRYPSKGVESCKKVWILSAAIFFWPFLVGANYIFYLVVLIGLVASASKLSKPKSYNRNQYSKPIHRPVPTAKSIANPQRNQYSSHQNTGYGFPNQNQLHPTSTYPSPPYQYNRPPPPPQFAQPPQAPKAIPNPINNNVTLPEGENRSLILGPNNQTTLPQRTQNYQMGQGKNQPIPQDNLPHQQNSFVDGTKRWEIISQPVNYSPMDKSQLLNECQRRGLKANWWTSDKNALIRMLEGNDRGHT